MTEYLIVAAVIAISAIAVFSFFGETLRHQVAGISQSLTGDNAEALTSLGAANDAATAASGAAAIDISLENYNQGTLVGSGQ